jgi:hypothetical protein
MITPSKACALLFFSSYQDKSKCSFCIFLKVMKLCGTSLCSAFDRRVQCHLCMSNSYFYLLRCASVFVLTVSMSNRCHNL